VLQTGNERMNVIRLDHLLGTFSLGSYSPYSAAFFRITGLDKLLPDGLLESGKYPNIDNSVIGARQRRQEQWHRPENAACGPFNSIWRKR
jgi:hypothetical protein